MKTPAEREAYWREYYSTVADDRLTDALHTLARYLREEEQTWGAAVLLEAISRYEVHNAD